MGAVGAGDSRDRSAHPSEARCSRPKEAGHTRRHRACQHVEPRLTFPIVSSGERKSMTARVIDVRLRKIALPPRVSGPGWPSATACPPWATRRSCRARLANRRRRRPNGSAEKSQAGRIANWLGRHENLQSAQLEILCHEAITTVSQDVTDTVEFIDVTVIPDLGCHRFVPIGRHEARHRAPPGATRWKIAGVDADCPGFVVVADQPVELFLELDGCEAHSVASKALGGGQAVSAVLATGARFELLGDLFGCGAVPVRSDRVTVPASDVGLDYSEPLLETDNRLVVHRVADLAGVERGS